MGIRMIIVIDYCKLSDAFVSNLQTANNYSQFANNEGEENETYFDDEDD